MNYSQIENLGCCEYISAKGEVAHILGCCCDCEAIDSTVDRCLRCAPQPPGIARQMSGVVLERLRIPWLGGALGGSAVRAALGGPAPIQVHIDTLLPIIVIPTLLILAISHQYVAWAVSIGTPITLYLYYKCWRRNSGRTRTRFFYSWGLVSIFTTAYVFFGVCCYREILLCEGMLVLTLFLLMLYALYLTKQDPGSLRPNVAENRTFTLPKNQLNLFRHQNGSTNSSAHTQDMLVTEKLDQLQAVGSGDGLVGDNHSSYYSDHCQQLQPSSSIMQECHPARHTDFPKLSCIKCKLKLTPRASHCNVCHACYAARDHHCIWLDQCIGLRNHRSFIVLIILFLFISIYGLHLSLTTICTPIMILDMVLWPNDCRFVYSDLMGAVAYVCCCYTAVSVVCVLLLFIQQMVLISQNITMQEFNQAYKTNVQVGRRHWLSSVIIQNNPYNKGFVKNWISFLRNNRNEIIEDPS